MSRVFRRPIGKGWWIAVMLLVFAAISVVMPTIRRVGEIKVYSLAAERLVNGQQFYRPLEHPPFTYPPFFALPLAPLVAFPFDVQRSIWAFVNLTLLAAIVLTITWMVWPVVMRGRERGRPPVWVNTLLIATLAGRFLISPLEYESHDYIVLGLVILAGVYLAVGRPSGAGISAGLAAACKATPLLVLPLLLWHRRFVASLLLIATLVVATLLPDLLFPNKEGGLWAQCWYQRFISKVEIGQTANAEGAWASWNSMNQSLAGTMYRLSTPVTPTLRHFDVSLWKLEGPSLRIVTITLQLAIVALLAWMTMPSRMAHVAPAEVSFFWLGQIGAVLCGMLLLSPISSTQHFCALIVPITFCVTHWMYRRRNTFIAAVFAALFLIGSLGAQDIAGEELEDLLSAYGAKTFCTLLCLFGTAYILVRERRSPWDQEDMDQDTSRSMTSAAERLAA